MTATKLKLYNGALTELGERTLSTLTDEAESRRALDTIWDNGFIDECLQAGQWNFAARTAVLDFDANISPTFGYARGFAKPSDWVRTMGVSEDEYFTQPLKYYADERGYWWADIDELYVKWVSNDSNYGNNLSLWPSNFRFYAETYLARKVAPRLTQDQEKLKGLISLTKKALSEARSTDAMDGPVGMPPRGQWSRSRHGDSRNVERRGS